MPGIDTSMYTQSQPNAFLGTAQQAVGIQGQQLANQQAHQDLVKGQVQYLAGGLGILANKPDLSQDDMANFAQNALKEGIISPQTYQVEMQNVQAAGNDPAKLRPLAANYAQRALDAGAQFQSTFGTPTSVSTGSNTVLGNQNPFTGAFTPASSVQQGMAPGDANSLVDVTMSDGSQRQVPKSQAAGLVSGSNQLTQAAPAGQAAQGNVTGSTFAPGTGVPLAAPPSGPTPGVIPSAQQSSMFQASTAQYQAAKANDANYTANLIPLQKMIELLPQTQTGLGAETTTNLAKVAQTFGINLPGSSTQADYYSQLEKYANVLARSSGAAPNSDAQLLASMSSNPNVTMNNAAAQDVAKTMLALQRMQHAAITTAQQQGMDNTPQSYSTFASQWGAQQDPRAYGVDLMTPEAKAALRKELSGDPAAAAKFANSYTIAKQAGVLGGITPAAAAAGAGSGQ